MSNKFITTLNRIEANHPCADVWQTLLAYLGKTAPDDEPLSLLTILESNGLMDAIWALSAVDDVEKEAILLACDFAGHVLPLWEAKYPNDTRPAEAIRAAQILANGPASSDDKNNAWAAAATAAATAVDAAVDADVAWAAWAAADAAAAWAAARAAWASDADAARAASAARRTASAAQWAPNDDDARAAEQNWQRQKFIAMCNGCYEEA